MTTAPQLFNFNSTEIRVIKDENGNPWIVADDVCRILGYKQTSPAIKKHCRPKGVTKCNILTDGGSQKFLCINEGNLYRLAANSKRSEAETFEEWIFDEVLPSIRKTGTYTLSSLLLPDPRKWEKTFPNEFMRQVMKLYGYDYNPKTGTPQFVGKFITKYVYDTLDKKMTKALKEARRTFGGDDEVSFLHQFLNDDARVGLQQHIVAVTTLASATSTIEGFDAAFSNVYQHKNQLKLYIR